MNICFIVTSDSVSVDKPPMATVFHSWKEACSFVDHYGFPEVKKLDCFDDVITCKGVTYSNEKVTINIKAGTLRGTKNAL